MRNNEGLNCPSINHGMFLFPCLAFNTLNGVTILFICAKLIFLVSFHVKPRLTVALQMCLAMLIPPFQYKITHYFVKNL